ncbi:hypothetical protein ACO0LB_03940 [Undibacterium sp. SXout7W]|uniref:hypothetical protein n=1 Tax=Undibacterium sp. SXout7W TaxID=3413049 RepID=UPI003BF0DF2E
MRNLFVVLVFLTLTFSTTVSAFGESPFTGTFISNLDQNGVMFLSLVQTQTTVSGLLVSVYPDNEQGTRSHTNSLRGETDGKILILKDGSLVLNGKKSGSSISLTFPDRSGLIFTATFIPGTETEFNRSVIKLRDTRLSQIALNKETERQAEGERQKLFKLVNILQADVAAIKNTDIKSDLESVASSVKGAYSAIKDIEAHLAKLKREASVRPMTCYQANQTVRYGFEQTMRYDFSQTLGYAANNYKNGIQRLGERLEKVSGMVAKIDQEANDLRQAIKIAKFGVPKLTFSPGEEQAPLKQYQELAALARGEMPRLQQKLDNAVSRAKELMQEGEQVMRAAQDLVRCN